MEINKYSSVLRSLAVEENVVAWSAAHDKLHFCSQLANLEHEHPIVNEIVAGALNQILSRKAHSNS